MCLSNGVLRDVANEEIMVDNNLHFEKGNSLKFHVDGLMSLVMNLDL